MAPGNPQEWNRGFHGNAPRIGPDVTAGRAPRSPPSARRGGGSGPAPSSRGTPHWWPGRSFFRARQWQRGVRAGGWDRARASRGRMRVAEAWGGGLSAVARLQTWGREARRGSDGSAAPGRKRGRSGGRRTWTPAPARSLAPLLPRPGIVCCPLLGSAARPPDWGSTRPPGGGERPRPEALPKK